LSKLRIAFCSPLGFFKGWQALRKLEWWAKETGVFIPRQLPKQKRLTALFEEFKQRLQRGQRARLIICRERRGLNRHKSYYRSWLDARGFPGRKKPKVATQPSPTNPYVAYQQQQHPSSVAPGDFLIPPGAQVVHFSGTAGNFVVDSSTAATPVHPQNWGTQTIDLSDLTQTQMHELFPDEVGPEHA
jgi:hypothetical protein